MAGFADIVGHEQVIQNLRHAILDDHVPHVIMFIGLAGVGKNLIVNAFAQTLLCEHKNGSDACGKCISCRTFVSGNHPDVRFVTTKKTKSIGVDDVRDQILYPMESKPYRGSYKIFIVDKAETMTISAQNALLKEIEEPAAYGIFLFISENVNAFLPTILSRSVVCHIKPLSINSVKNYLMSRMDEEKAAFYAVFSEGSIGQAIKLASSEMFLEMRQTVASISQILRDVDLIDVFEQFPRLEKYKENVQEILDLFLLWYRDAIVMKETNNSLLIIQADKKNEIIDEAKNTLTVILYNKFDAIWEAKRNLKQNGNFQLTLEMMLLKLTG